MRDSRGSSVSVLGIALTVATALTVLLFGLKKPYDNWDMVGYVAVALNAEGLQGAQLNEATYDAIRRDVDAATFDQLSQADSYRTTVFRDPASLAQQLPFYSIRVLYMRTLEAVRHMGADYPRVCAIVSATFATLSVLLLALLCRRVDVPLIAIPLVVAIAGFIELARLATPDAMACFFALWAIYCLIQNSATVFVVAVVLPLVRTDFVLLSGLILACTYFSGKKVPSVAAVLLAAMFYVLDVTMNHGYSWTTLFNTSLISKTAYPATLVPSHAIGDYIRPYVSMAYGITMHPHFVIYGLAIAWMLMRPSITRGKHDDLFYPMYVVPLSFVVLHLALFPANSYRYFVFAAALVALWLLAGLMKQVAQNPLVTELTSQAAASAGKFSCLEPRSTWATSEASCAGWLESLAEERIRRVLAAMYADPFKRWTVEMLAAVSLTSRSIFAERFTEVVGEPPLRYLSRWRLTVAADMLRSGRLKVAEAAHRTGFASDAAFSRAFKNHFGYAPGEV